MTRRIACLLLALLLLGCTDVATTGPVQEVPLGVEPGGVQILAAPPQPGVTPVRLVEGFVQAMAVPEADYSVARQYLSPGVASAWNPQEGGTVYKGVVSERDGAVAVTGTRTGVLDEAGRFTATSDTFSHDFGLVEVDGEWRIGAPPDGVLVSDYIFERYWSHVTVYFMADTSDHVVPDLVHIPDALLTPSRVIEAQIAGPSASIAPSVINAVGPQVQLGAEGASVDAQGTASVALTGLPATMPDERRRLLGAQVLWSLTAIPRVTGLRITSGGAPFQLPGQNVDGVLELASQQGFQLLSRAATADLFGVRDGVGGRIGPNDVFLPMSSDSVAVSEVAVSVDGTLVAFLDDTRTTVLIGPLGGAPVRVTPGWSNLRSAQFSLGNLWVLGDDGAAVTHLLRVDAQGSVTKVESADTPGTIVDFSLTQAGVRLAAVVERSGTRRLVMATLVGGAEPRLVAADELPLLSLRNPLTAYRSLDWSGETQLAVVADAAGVHSVFLTTLDGALVEDLGPLAKDAVQISALPRPGGDAIVVRAQDGTVLRHDSSTRWSRMKEVLQEISFPG